MSEALQDAVADALSWDPDHPETELATEVLSNPSVVQALADIWSAGFTSRNPDDFWGYSLVELNPYITTTGGA